MAVDRIWDASGMGLRGALSVVVGASEGIGAAIAVGLADAGCDVVVAGRSAERLQPTVDEILQKDRAAHVHVVDVREPGEVEAFASAVREQHGTPRVLVNSMGGTLNRPALDVTVEEWDDIHDTHLRGTFLVSKAFAPAMGEAGYGKVINLSSTFAFTVVPGRSAYAVAKAGLSHLTSVLAVEWAGMGILVNALAPTSTRTPRVEAAISEAPETEDYFVQRIPLGRLALPEEMVGPALFLASPMSDFVTGHTLMVDGGWVAAK